MWSWRVETFLFCSCLFGWLSKVVFHGDWGTVRDWNRSNVEGGVQWSVLLWLPKFLCSSSVHRWLLVWLQTLSAVVSFPGVQEAVDTTVQILQCGVPMARIGEFSIDFRHLHTTSTTKWCKNKTKQNSAKMPFSKQLANSLHKSNIEKKKQKKVQQICAAYYIMWWWQPFWSLGGWLRGGGSTLFSFFFISPQLYH